MVKNNVPQAAETDLHNAVVLNAIDITASLVKNQKAEINQIPSLVDQIVQAFTNSAAMSGIAIPSVLAATTVATPPAVEAGAATRKKRELSGEEREAMLARMAKARAARAVAKAQAELPVLRRGRGRPRKEPEVKPEPLAHAKRDRDQARHYRTFLLRNPAKCSIAESLEDTGDGKMTCLIDGKRVSFLNTYLLRNYGMTFEDYSRIYGLPADYPTTPPKFKAGKREDAKRVGLGTIEMRNALKGKLDGATQAETEVAETDRNELAADTPVVVARPSGRARKTKVVDVSAVATAA